MSIDKKLPRVKKIELDILNVVDDFCKNNNLRYSLAYGTLLGAVRHKGFIPWDDDIDIWMPREDYDAFNELWIKNPVKGYIIQNAYIEPEFTQNFTKIRKDNTAFIQIEEEKNVKYHKGIFIDIFPLDRVSLNPVGKKIQEIDAVLMQLFTRKFVPPKEHGIKKIISSIILTFTPKNKYDKLKAFFERAVSRRSSVNGGYKYFGSMMSLSKKPYSCNMFDNLESVAFENDIYYATAVRSEVLTKFYGNYMELPPKNERVWAHHPILIDFDHNYEELMEIQNEKI